MTTFPIIPLDSEDPTTIRVPSPHETAVLPPVVFPLVPVSSSPRVKRVSTVRVSRIPQSSARAWRMLSVVQAVLCVAFFLFLSFCV